VKSSSRVSFMSAVTSEMTFSNCRSRLPASKTHTHHLVFGLGHTRQQQSDYCIQGIQESFGVQLVAQQC
jgi:hypothetical protein